jgi:hypothetical protein
VQSTFTRLGVNSGVGSFRFLGAISLAGRVYGERSKTVEYVLRIVTQSVAKIVATTGLQGLSPIFGDPLFSIT